MKKLILFLLILCSSASLIAQENPEARAYSKKKKNKNKNSFFDQNDWFYAIENDWSTLNMDDLPKGKIKLLDVYQKAFETGLMLVMEDNSIWWNENERWYKARTRGLPENYKIKAIKPYARISQYATLTAGMVIMLEDNSLWKYNVTKWQKISNTNLPEDETIELLSTYQRNKVMLLSFETLFVVLMSDNSVWYLPSKSKKWKEYEGNGLPNDKTIKLIEAYSKVTQIPVRSGRILAVLSDESIWWSFVKDGEWEQVDTKNLPENYKIRTIRAYQKGLSKEPNTKILVVLEDNSIWRYTHDNGFSLIDISTIDK